MRKRRIFQWDISTSPFLNTILLTIRVSQLWKTTRLEVSPNKPTITTIIRGRIRSIDSPPWVRVTWSILGPKYAWVGSTISRSFIESSVYSLTAEAKIEPEFSSIASRDHFISRNAHAPPPSSPPLSRQLSTRARTRCNTVGGSVADAQAATNPDGLEAN